MKGWKELFKSIAVFVCIALLNVILFLVSYVAGPRFFLLGHLKGEKTPLPLMAISLGMIIFGIIFFWIGFPVRQINEENILLSIAYNNLLSCTLGIIFFVVAFGLFFLKEWARKITIWLSLISIPVRIWLVLLLFSKQNTITANDIVSTIIAVGAVLFVVLYLSREWVKELFVRKRNLA